MNKKKKHTTQQFSWNNLHKLNWNVSPSLNEKLRRKSDTPHHNNNNNQPTTRLFVIFDNCRVNLYLQVEVEIQRNEIQLWKEANVKIKFYDYFTFVTIKFSLTLRFNDEKIYKN